MKNVIFDHKITLRPSIHLYNMVDNYSGEIFLSRADYRVTLGRYVKLQSMFD